MREIEFRAKSETTNQWVFGSLCDDRWAKTFVIYPFTPDDEDLVGETVKAETIGQFTGLPDKNGKKIFEGDIIKTYHGIAKVVYSQQFALFGYIMLEQDNHEKEFDYRFTEISIEEGIEVIGNIYDNPELLEG